MRIGPSARATLAGIIVVAGVAGAAAETVMIEAARDATLIEDGGGAWSNGSGPQLFAGTISAGTVRRTLIAFDVGSAVPAGAEILAVRLSLEMTQTSGGPTQVSLHRIVAAWGEGASSASGGTGAPSEEGDATWIHTFYDTGFWAEPGGDIVASSASTPVDQAGRYAFGPTSGLIEDVRAWLADPESNHGWMLRGDESEPTTVKRFASRENPDPAARPVLIVEFVVPRGDEDRDEDEEDDAGGGTKRARPPHGQSLPDPTISSSRRSTWNELPLS